LAPVTAPEELAADRLSPNASPRRLWKLRLGSIPSPLAALAVCVAIFGVAWALVVPPFQAPDEIDHFGYAQSLATRLALPGDPRRPLGLSSDAALAVGTVGAANLAFQVQSVRPNWSPGDFAGYLAKVQQHPSQSDGGGPNAQAVNPPLFYLYSDLAYWASGSDNLFGRLYAMRLWGVPLLMLTVLAAWLLAGEVLGRARLSQLVCAAVSGLVPMETFISTSVTPDALLVPLWTLALWLGARIIRRGLGRYDAIALGAVTAAAILTKATSYALLPGVLMALVIGWRLRASGERRAFLRRALGAMAALVLPVLAWLLLTRKLGRSAVNTVPAASGPAAPSFRVRGFVNYVWQFYLPHLPRTHKLRLAMGLPVYSVWLRGGWGLFGWLDVPLPAWIYGILAACSAVMGLTGGWLLARLRDPLRLRLAGFFVLVTLALLFGLHVTAYRSILAHQGPLLQGRYLLPLIGVFGLTVARAVGQAPGRWREVAAGGALAGLLVLQIVALATVTKMYYT